MLVTHQNTGPPWSGASSRTVVELIDHCCRRKPSKPVMIFEDGLVLTRQEFLDRAERFAGHLATQANPGERVAILLGTRAETMIALAAAMAVGCVPVLVDPAAKTYDAGYILRDSECVVAIVAETNRGLIEGLRPECPSIKAVIMATAAEPEGLAAWGSEVGRFRFSACKATGQDVAAIYYTSGTTGRPKGCMLDHCWWLRLCDIHLRMARPRKDDRTLCCVPFHYTDSAFQLLCALLSDGTLVVMRRFSVSRFWEVVHRNNVREVYLVASMPILLLKGEPRPIERRHGLRLALCAGVPARLHRQLVDRFGVPFLDTYGTTETGWNIRMPAAYSEEKIGSGAIGVAVPEAELRVVDEEDRDIPVGECGELLVRGPGLFAGYLNRPEATADAMRGGWYHTGDLVRVDTRGFYYFLGRSHDVIRRAGQNIAAAEVEDVLRTHPRIRDAAVIGVPNELWGEEVKAYVLLAEDSSPAALPANAIAAYCADRLAPFKVPRYVEYWVGDFPRTPTMRVRKMELRAAAGSAVKLGGPVSPMTSLPDVN
jgi:carnitine-CoA ligase